MTIDQGTMGTDVAIGIVSVALDDSKDIHLSRSSAMVWIWASRSTWLHRL